MSTPEKSIEPEKMTIGNMGDEVDDKVSKAEKILNSANSPLSFFANQKDKNNKILEGLEMLNAISTKILISVPIERLPKTGLGVKLNENLETFYSKDGFLLQKNIEKINKLFEKYSKKIIKPQVDQQQSLQDEVAIHDESHEKLSYIHRNIAAMFKDKPNLNDPNRDLFAGADMSNKGGNKVNKNKGIDKNKGGGGLRPKV